ncbi:hypothetical protein IAR55_006366 [Kwoniella newhampshirensis]|uniref:N-acetyltransferase domain-containing protein n=1 Tax=Kwoniella newhampshirensis TaxID=1651941 RepID=A0AAW0YTN5_9TREE
MNPTTDVPVLEWDEINDEPYIVLPGKPDFRLTPLRSSDVQDWWELFNSPAISANSIRNPKPFPKELAAKQVDTRSAAARPFVDRLRAGAKVLNGSPFDAIREHASGKLIGDIHIYLSDNKVPPIEPRSDLDWVNETWDIGYNMSPAYEGKGLMKAATRALLDGYLMPYMKLRQISAGSRDTNSASHAVLRRSGFVEVYRYSRTLPPELGGSTVKAVKFKCVLPAQ